MKAVTVFPGKREVKLVDHPAPHITASDQVKLRVLDVGLCGTDQEIATFEYGKTFVYSREKGPDKRIDLLHAIGASYLSSQDVPVSELSQQTGNIDLVYEAAGHSGFALSVLHELGMNGIYILTGVPGRQPLVEADPASLFRDIVLKNQIVLGTVNAGPQAFSAAINDLALFMRCWPEAVRGLIGERRPIEDAPELIRQRAGGIKSVISFDHAASASA